MKHRRLRQAGLAMLTAPLGCAVAAQLGQLAPVPQVSHAALAAQVSHADQYPNPNPSPYPSQDPHWYPYPPPWQSGPGPYPPPWQSGPDPYPGPQGQPYPDPGWHRHWHWHPGPDPSGPPVPSPPTSSPSPAASLTPSRVPAPPAAPAPHPSQVPSPSAAPAPRLSPSHFPGLRVAAGPHAAASGANHAQRQSWPVTLTIRTLPALPGVRFSFDGTSRATNANGEVSYTEQHNFGQHTLAVIDTSIVTQLRHYRFTRWAGERDPADAFTPMVRGLPMRASYTVTAGFTVQCQVLPRFTDQHGRALDSRDISRVTLKSNAGPPVNISATHASWLDCSRPAYRNSTLISNDTRYATQAVMFANTNVVYAGVQRFSPREQASPTIVGYFHNLTITAHDALFGGRIGSSALVTLPSHAVRRVPLGPGHTGTLDHLPLGDYHVNIRADGAIISTGSFRLSRTKTVNLTAVSAPDLATVGGGLLLVGGGLPLLAATRRRWLLDHLRSLRRDQPPGSLV